MKKNMGSADKTIRVFIALLIVVLYFTKVVTGTLAIVLLVASGIFLLTSMISLCPLYGILGIRTNKKAE